MILHPNSPNFLIVGSGFFGSTIAERLANISSAKVKIVERRNHIGGNCYSRLDERTGIELHVYGTHIFHTSNPRVWNYIRQFTDFNNYYHQVLTTYKNRVYKMPINLETINSFYGINLRPFEVKYFLEKEISKEGIIKPKNLEEKAISLVGRPLYEAFIKGYTMKQWQKHPSELPLSILTRLPFRNNYYDCYFNDKWQGIPLNGYSSIFERMLSSDNISLSLDTDFFDIRDSLPDSTYIIYSGPIDRFFNYKYGKLKWRTLEFNHKNIAVADYQGTSVMNYAEEFVPYTRIHEPRHLHPERRYPQDKTIIIKEYSKTDDGNEPYYPINDIKNQSILRKYREEAKKCPNVFFGGRLGEYNYLDMDQTIEKALDLFDNKLRPLF